MAVLNDKSQYCVFVGVMHLGDSQQHSRKKGTSGRSTHLCGPDLHFGTQAQDGILDLHPHSSLRLPCVFNPCCLLVAPREA